MQTVLTALCGLTLVISFFGIHPVFAYLAVAFGSPFALRAAWDALRERELDINLLMVGAAVGAIAVGHPDDAAALLFLFALSGTLETYAMGRTRSAIQGLIKLRPETAIRVLPEGDEKVAVQELRVGDLVRVGAFEAIPADGLLDSGTAQVDQQAMTGESRPVPREAGDPLLAGTRNLDTMLLMRVTAEVGRSTLDRIVELVQDAQENKASGEKVSAWFGKRYTLFVVGAFALSLAVRLVIGAEWGDALYGALTLLVALSPCALVISTPATTLSALAWAARRGVLVRGGAYIEAAGRIDTIALDKTGTLTRGRPALAAICLPEPACTGAVCSQCWQRGGNMSDQALEMLALAAAAEQYSTHPIAEAVVAGARARGLDVPESPENRAIPGLGVEATVNGRQVLVGQGKLFDDLPEWVESKALELQSEGMTVAMARVDERWALLGMRDTVREGTREVLQELRELGVVRQVMLTGDNGETARKVAHEVGIEEVHASLMPDEKTALIRALGEEGRATMMVGDGINDAPSLAGARVGVAMGGLGSDIALNAADIVLMQDRLDRLPDLIRLGRSTQATIRANLIFAAGVILILTVASLVIRLPLPVAVIGHEGSTVLVILNGLRLLAGPSGLLPWAKSARTRPSV